MRKLLQMFAVAALVATGCHSLGDARHPTGLPLRYHNPRYGLTFFLPASWQGYSVLTNEWIGYPSKVEDGVIIVFRNPQWRADDRYQDIPIMVFTHRQWDALQSGKFFPYAGGLISEAWQNHEYVFGIYSRYDWYYYKNWKQADEILKTNFPVEPW